MLVMKLKTTDRLIVGDLVIDIKSAGSGRVHMAIGAPEHVAIRKVIDLEPVPEGDQEADVTLHALD